MNLIGWMNAKGELVQEELDLSNPHHRALFEIFSDGCPECQRLLQSAPPLEKPVGSRAERRRALALARKLAKRRR